MRLRMKLLLAASVLLLSIAMFFGGYFYRDRQAPQALTQYYASGTGLEINERLREGWQMVKFEKMGEGYKATFTR